MNKKIERYLNCGSIPVLDVDPQEKPIAGYSSKKVRTYREGAKFAPAVPRFAS